MLDSGSPEISDEQFHTAACLVGQLDSWEIDTQGPMENGFAEDRGTVLVFLPGEDYYKHFTKQRKLN